MSEIDTTYARREPVPRCTRTQEVQGLLHFRTSSHPHQTLIYSPLETRQTIVRGKESCAHATSRLKPSCMLFSTHAHAPFPIYLRLAETTASEDRPLPRPPPPPAAIRATLESMQLPVLSPVLAPSPQTRRSGVEKTSLFWGGNR